MATQLNNIDNGGTLTDICIIDGERVEKTTVLTTPYDLSKCFFEGLQKASGVIYGSPDVKRLLEEVDLIRYSTTQGTNAICERKGAQVMIAATEDSRYAGLQNPRPGCGHRLRRPALARAVPGLHLDLEQAQLHAQPEGRAHRRTRSPARQAGGAQGRASMSPAGRCQVRTAGCPA